MGLDLYVGTLARYFTRRWETAQQQWAREQGIPSSGVTYVGNFPMRGFSYGEAHRVVQQWRIATTKAMQRAGLTLEPWSEEIDQPYSTAQVPRPSLGGLMLWAAYDERPDLMPRDIRVDDFAADPAYNAVLDPAARSGSICGVHVWLPCSLTHPGLMVMPDGIERVVSSLAALDRALSELNARTWRVGNADVKAWVEEARHCTLFEAHARIGFHRFRTQLATALERQQPMVLDS